MTVNTLNITDGPYTGNGIAASFSYTFKIDESSEIAVYETDTFGVTTQLTLGTHYTVSGLGSPSGGTVTRVAGALPTGYTWYLRSAYIPTQLTAFASQGGFFPDVHEYVADKLSYIAQQLQDESRRSIRLQVYDPSIETGDMHLPGVGSRAGNILAFDAQGNPVMLSAGSFSPIDIPAINYVGDNATVLFALPGFSVTSGTQLFVAIDGIVQNAASYSVINPGPNIQFTQAPPLNSAIEIRAIGVSIESTVSPVSTTALLASIASSINTTGKYQGKPVFNTTTNIPVWAVGSLPGDVWVDATGATAHTPV